MTPQNNLSRIAPANSIGCFSVVGRVDIDLAPEDAKV